MFDQTAQPQISDDGNNGNPSQQSDPQVVQPVDQVSDQVIGQSATDGANQPNGHVTDQSTNQNQANPTWDSMLDQSAPPSGMTRVPMVENFAVPQTADQANQVNDNMGHYNSSNDVGQSVLSSGDGSSDQTPAPTSEKLEDQNIFYMLGVTDGTEEQKNQFLDELQQVIWEDFLDEDVKLLLTQEEQTELAKLKAAKPDAKLEEQEEVIVYLEKLIPDLEDILLEKALELKADLMKERVAGMRELYKDKPENLGKIDEAERMMGEEKWLSAAQALNSITTT